MQPYPGLLPYFSSLSEVLTKKFNQIGNFERQYCFGFSFGARLCAEAGIRVGNQSIDRMDLCDPAGEFVSSRSWKLANQSVLGPGFTSKHDPKPAAKHVACINTSNIKGTTIYNCHQNFRMGKCGKTQAGASRFPLGSHGLCPYFYNLAFTHDFVPNNHYNCSSTRILRSFVGNVKMGYMGDFDRTVNVGDIFIATAKYSPFIVINGIIDNIDNSTTTLTPELTPTNFDQESKIFTNQFMIQWETLSRLSYCQQKIHLTIAKRFKNKKSQVNLCVP